MIILGNIWVEGRQCRNTQEKEGPVTTEAEIEIVLPQPKGSPGIQAGRGKEGYNLRLGFKGRTVLPIL